MIEAIKQKAIEEVELATFGITQQFFEVHKVLYADGKPVIARVDTERENGTTIVYFPIVDQPFFFAVYVTADPEPEVQWVETEDNYCVYLKAVSNSMSAAELCGLTKLLPTRTINKGDKHFNGIRSVSHFHFEPNPEQDVFDDKLNKLLDLLEEDIDGVKSLSAKTDTWLQVAIEYYDRNTMIGGPHLTVAQMKRLVALNLDINFDQYTCGTPLKDDL